MAQPCESLSRHVEWHRVLPSLGSPLPAVKVLPQTVICPLCHSHELVVSRDYVLGGEWTSCGRCQFAGDLIELAARKWEIGIPDALARLSSTGMLTAALSDKLVEGYIRDHVELRRRLRDFWETARHAPIRRPSVATRRLLRAAGIYCSGVSVAWPEERGMYLGAATRQEVEDVFAPLAYAAQPRDNGNGKATTRRGGGAGPQRPFNGEGWDDVLVMPYYDLPGRICAFHFIGRSANYAAGDYIYRRANLGPTSVAVREAGVGMLPAIRSKPHRLFGDDVFVISDPLVAVILQARSVWDGSRGLPIVLSHFTPEIQTLRLPHPLPERPLIFWGTHPALMLQAKRSNGRISTFKITQIERDRRLNHRRPSEWLALIRKRAVPWYIVLQNELRKLDREGICARLLSLEFTSAELADFYDHCPPELSQRIHEADPNRMLGRCVEIDGKTVLETARGWELEKSGELICNLPVRLTEILTTTAGERFYRGTVTLPDSLTIFTLEKAGVERRGLFPCLQDVLAADGAAPFAFHPSWAKRSEFIATQMHPPRLIPQAERIGWSEERLGFVFNQFIIRLGGEVVGDDVPVIQDETTPAQSLEYPGRLPFQLQQSLSADTNEVGLVWAMLACICRNLFSKIIYQDPNGILLDGIGAREAGPLVAAALGCAQLNLRRSGNSLSVPERINQGCLEHDWPRIVHLSQKTKTLEGSSWLDAPGPRNAILSLDSYATSVASCFRGFTRITCGPTLPMGSLLQQLPALLPAYVQYACSRNLFLDSTSSQPVLNILDDMAAWFVQLGFDAAGTEVAGIEAAKRLLSFGGYEPENCLVEVSCQMIADGHLVSMREGFKPRRQRKPAIIYKQTTGNAAGAVHVPVQAINELLAALAIPILPLAAISDSLRGRGVLLDDVSDTAPGGWSLCAEWWDEQVRRWQRREESPIQNLNMAS